MKSDYQALLSRLENEHGDDISTYFHDKKCMDSHWWRYKHRMYKAGAIIKEDSIKFGDCILSYDKDEQRISLKSKENSAFEKLIELIFFYDDPSYYGIYEDVCCEWMKKYIDNHPTFVE